jgi:hypothetical protein
VRAQSEGCRQGSTGPETRDRLVHQRPSACPRELLRAQSSGLEGSANTSQRTCSVAAVAWISIGDAASALVTDVDGIHQLVASGVLSCVHGSDRRVMLDPDEVRAVLLGERAAPAIPTSLGPQGETGPVSPADHEPSDAPEGSPERSAEEILAGEGDVVERGKLAARIILALEDEIDALTDLVRDAAVELTRRGATSPEIAEELGISSAAVVRLLTGLPVMGDDLPRTVALEGETITVPVAERWTSPDPDRPDRDDRDEASVLVGVGGPDEGPDRDEPVGGNWELWRPEDEFVPDDDSATVEGGTGDEPRLDQRDALVEAVAEMLSDDALPTEAPPASVDEPAVFVGSTQVDAELARGCLATLLGVLFPWRLLPVPEALRRLFRR